jgi:Ni,Fe-hydrogenase maturation factor
MGAHLPVDVTVVAVESPPSYVFSEELSPPVAAAVPQAVDLVIDLLNEPVSTKPHADSPT